VRSRGSRASTGLVASPLRARTSTTRATARSGKRLGSVAQSRATRLSEHLDFLIEQKERAESDLPRGSQAPIVLLLETAPGFGPIRSARLVPIVVTPHRFLTKRLFWGDCGLGIVTRSSSDWVRAAEGQWIRARVPQTRGLSRQ
jgi:transposase